MQTAILYKQISVALQVKGQILTSLYKSEKNKS